MLYFKVYKSQLAVIEQALETASLMLGGQKARGYCLEMVCADFLAGASLHDCGNAESLLLALSRTYQLLPTSQRQEFLLRIPKASRILPSQDSPGVAWTRFLTKRFVSKCFSAIAGDANGAEVPKIFRYIICSREAIWETMWKKISLRFAAHAIGRSTSGPKPFCHLSEVKDETNSTPCIG